MDEEGEEEGGQGEEDSRGMNARLPPPFPSGEISEGRNVLLKGHPAPNPLLGGD